MDKKGQLEEIPVEEAELKELKKELNRYGVKFSVMKDKESGKYSVFFQAKDMKVMDKALNMLFQNRKRKRKGKSPFIRILRSSRRWLKTLFPKIKSRINKRSRAYDR